METEMHVKELCVDFALLTNRVSMGCSDPDE